MFLTICMGCKMEKKVSIVIPLYQSEEYIAECLESILEQSYPYIEVILVNDGSKDGSDEICERYCKKYSHIKVIHQTNQGPGMARSNGEKAAIGEYILFVDSDDCLDGPDAVKLLVECAEKEQADITVGSFRTFYEGRSSEINYHHLDKLSDAESVEFRFRGYFQYGHLGFNWAKLYRKDFLDKNRIESLPYPYIEDKAYNMRCSACKPRYAFVRDSVYRYRMKEGDIPFQDKADFITVWTRVGKEFEEYLIEKGCVKEYQDLTGIHMFLGIYTLANKLLQSENGTVSSVRKALKEYCSNEFARKQFRELRRGNYVKELESFGWKFVIRVTATICCMKAYGLLAFGMKVMNGMSIDKKVISKKYRK